MQVWADGKRIDWFSNLVLVLTDDEKDTIKNMGDTGIIGIYCNGELHGSANKKKICRLIKRIRRSL